MRTKFTLILKTFLLILFSNVCLGLQAQTQTVPSFTFTIQNEVQTSDRTLEFDGYILSTDPSTVLEVANTDFAVTFNTAMLNGGTLTATLVSGSSQMSASQQPTVKVLTGGGVTTVYAYSYSISGKGTGTTISTTAPGTRFCRLKVTNTVPFASVTANLAHHLAGVPAETTLEYYDQIDGNQYELDINSSTCYTSTVNPVLNTLPTVTFDNCVHATNSVSGTLSALGSPYPTDYGFVYSTTNSSPTLSDSYVSMGAASTTGSYTSILQHLTAGTTYYIRAYATNSVGTFYSTNIGALIASNLAPTGLSYNTPNVFTKGTAITSLSPTVTGTVTAYTVSTPLPAGLSLNATTGVISGTPTAVSPTTDYVITASNSEGGTNTTVRITVNDVAPSGLSYSTPNVYTKGTAITTLTPTVSGGAVTSYTVSPALPAGLSINATSGAISGTPTAITAAANYTVTATNSGGNTTAVVNVTVNDAVPSGLNYTTPNVYTKGSAITALSPTVGGGAVVSYSVSPALPAGLSLNTTTGVISGTPTAITATANYTVTATNTGGSSSKVVSITVNDLAPSGLNYSTPNVFTKGIAITALSPTVSGGTVTSYSVSPALPTGLSIDATTGIISGTPTAIAAAANYTVTATNTGGNSSKVVSITVNDVAPNNLNYNTPNVYTKGSAITALSPTVGGGAVVSYSVSPALPAGLSINASTGVISGTPTAIAVVANYTVTATNSGGNTTAVVNVTVNDVTPGSLSYTTLNVFTKGAAITSLSPTVSGGTITSYSISPALPTGLSISATTGVISGTPTVVWVPATYTVTGTNSGGTITTTLSITVNDIVPSSLSYTTPNVYTKGTPISALSPTVSGGTVISYSISPILPTGLSINATTGVISGTPTVLSSATVYTVTATNTGGSTAASLSIAVNDVTPGSLSYTTPNVFVKGTAITPLSPTVSGGTVTSYTISPALPTGLSINATTGVINGIPTAVTAVSNYTVTATNSGGTVSATLSVTINDVAPSDLSYTTPNVFTKGTGIANLVPTVSGGVITSYSVSPALPAGLSINTSTGVISGTPTVASALTSYTVAATNATGTASFVLSITVNEAAPSGLSYTTPNVFAKGTAINPLTPTMSGIVTSYSVSPALPAGLSINASTGVISGTPTAVVGQSTYTVIAANAGGNVSFNISIAVNDILPSGLSYQTPNVYTKGAVITPLSPTISGGTVTSYSIVPALPSGLSFNSSTGVISGTPTAIASATNYTVTATNSGGNVSFALSITVNDIPPTSLSYATPNVFNKGTAITTLSPTVIGGVVTNYSVSPSLPAGLSIDATTGVISGTPTAISSAANYTVTASNTGGSTSFTINITVLDGAPSGLKYTTPNVFTKEVSVVSLAPTVGGGTVTGYSVSPSLPAGLSINTTTGVISGTPTAVYATGNYTVTASNSGGSCTFVVTITVNDDITISPLASPSAGCEASDFALTYTVLSGVPTQYQVKFNDQAVLAGLSNIAYTAIPSSTGGTITFSVPKGMRAGTYTGYLQLKDNAGAESTLYSFEFTVNLSSDYIIAKFDDVIACDNSSYRFVSYQWYKNGVKIDGATKQFYNDPLGIIGTYMLQVTTTDGNTFFSCPKTFNIAKKSVKVFPNPVQANQSCSVQMIGFDESELQNATISVYDIMGVCTYKSSTVTNMNTLKLPSEQAYVGHVVTSNGQEYLFKIIVQK